MSSVFRRSSNASSLRDPETHARPSRDLSWRRSRLSMRPDAQEDVTSSASSIPLPSSPIPIPTPAPKLKLDFGTPELDYPFAGITHSALAEIRVLQDPRNITTGCPSSGPVNWPLENKRPLPREPVASGVLSVENDSRHTLAQPGSFMPEPMHDTGDPFGQILSPITVPGLSLQSGPNFAKYNYPDRSLSDCIGGLEHTSSHMHTHESPISAKPECSYTEVSYALEVRNPDSIEDFAGVSMRAMSDFGATPAKSPVSDVDEPMTAQEEKSSSPVELLELPPPPLFGLDARPRGDVDTASGIRSNVKDACTHQPLIAPLVSELTSLIAGAAQQSSEEKSSLNVVVGRSSMSSHGDGDATRSPMSAIDLGSGGEDPLNTGESSYLRKDSLFNDCTVEEIPQHGPPSPTRKVKLPLRLKNELTEHTSFESFIFQPNLDRAAAKQLGVFRPGSDPSLKQRYFPHLPVSPSTLVKHERQSTLDSDDGGTPTTQNSSEHSGIFERAVEAPSPLQVRKQSGFTVTHFSSSPGTPKESPSIAHAPSSSSPTRTPSMGNRQLFDLQRAERNARYNAIHSGDGHAKGDDGSDLQLADFGNAGPGSRGSSPKRNDSEDVFDMKESEALLELALAGLPTAQDARSAKGRVVFTLSRD